MRIRENNKFVFEEHKGNLRISIYIYEYLGCSFFVNVCLVRKNQQGEYRTFGKKIFLFIYLTKRERGGDVGERDRGGDGERGRWQKEKL